MTKKRDQSELPPLRMVRKGMSLVPADAFSEEMLDGIRHNAPVDVHWTYELVNPKRKKFWAVLNNVIKNCRTPWTNSKAAANALKNHLGVVDESTDIRGGTIRYPASTNDLTDEEFDVFYLGAMAVLHRITGIDPESLRREAPRVMDEPREEPRDVNEHLEDHHQEVARASEAGEPDERGTEGPAEPEPETPAPNMKHSQMASVPQSHLAFDPAAAVNLIMTEASRVPATPDERRARIAVIGTRLIGEFPDKDAFLGTVINTGNRVAKGDLRVESARAYLISIAPR